LILEGLREPYLFKQNVAEQMKLHQPQGKVTELLNKINGALTDTEDAMSRTFVREIRDELMQFNPSVSK